MAWHLRVAGPGSVSGHLSAGTHSSADHGHKARRGLRQNKGHPNRRSLLGSGFLFSPLVASSACMVGLPSTFYLFSLLLLPSQCNTSRRWGRGLRRPSCRSGEAKGKQNMICGERTCLLSSEYQVIVCSFEPIKSLEGWAWLRVPAGQWTTHLAGKLVSV